MSDEVRLDQSIATAVANLERVSSTAVPRATAMAINRVGKRAVSLSVRDTAKQVGVPAKRIRERTKLHNATATNPMAIIRVRRGAVPLILVGTARETKTGVRVGRHFVAGGFIADGSKGKGRYQRRRGYSKTQLRSEQVLRRTGKGRYPLEVVKIPLSEPLTTNFNRNTKALLQTDMPKEMRAALSQQLRLVIKKAT